MTSSLTAGSVVGEWIRVLRPAGRLVIVDGQFDLGGSLAHRRICGFCGRAFALVKPPDEEETERDKLCPACLKLPPPPQGTDDQPA